MSSRKEIDALTTIVKLAGGNGLAYLQLKDGSISGSLANKLSQEVTTAVCTISNMNDNETLFILAGSKSTVLKSGDKLRNACRDMFQLVDDTML